ncbi:hypothetical protein ROA7450_01993 [Roseovarius albus]|uniref:Immunity MXAN-0049 protein domain-containing protein n=1 Tax=Roseovarius albus TaxID=1247867 RepID=A0A1X6Z582_9RHOB|nr:DUF1629 domain-containing protein [Roseovarius albus]SLN41249.1 hypothetical protein ROA7450_01993 [Roseovarius albus]
MTWGMVEPKNFGEWWPDPQRGFYTWDETLQTYYDTEMSEADKVALDMADGVNRFTFSRKFTTDMGPVDRGECPQVYETRKPLKKLGALIMLSSGFLAVDEALKAVIETLEPDVHQFYPLRIEDQKAVAFPKAYFGLVIRQFRDSFRPDDSKEGSWEKMELVEGYSVVYELKEHINGLAMSTEAIGEAHLWRESVLSSPTVFFSDALQAEIKRQGLRVPKHFKVIEV